MRTSTLDRTDAVYCDRDVTTDRGYASSNENIGIWICPGCNRPTFFGIDERVPGEKGGGPVQHLPADVDALYGEARIAAAAAAPTACVLALRKLLMHVAVGCDADEGKSFVEYVNYLAEKGYVTANAKPWVEHIRKRSNEANHEIRMMKPDDANELLVFTEMMLKLVYEFPKRLPATPRS